MADFDKISSKSKNVQAFDDNIRKLKDLKKGIKQLKKRALDNPKDNEYIPKETNETSTDFENRVRYHTDLLNATKKAVDNVVNRTFERDAFLITENELLKEYSEDIDLRGTSLSNFLKNEMIEGCWFSKSYVFVDYSEDFRRPYAVLLKSENILDIRYDDYGKIKLLRTFSMEEREIDDFITEDVKIVRLYKKDENNNVTCTTYEEIDDEVFSSTIDLTIDEIPLVEYYPETTEKGLNPDIPFEDIAEKNIVHFRSNTDQRHILHYNRVPFLHMSGFSEENASVKFGVKLAMHSSNPNSKVEWVEANGKNVELGSKDLSNLEKQMEALGAEMLIEQSSSTVIEAQSKTMDTRTRGASMASNLQDFANELIRLFTKYMILGTNIEYDVDVNTNVKMSLSDVEFDLLIKLKTLGVISDVTLREQAQARGLLGDKYDEEEEKDRLDFEGGFLMDINEKELIEEENNEDVQTDEENIEE